jgi:hypothetical protein
LRIAQARRQIAVDFKRLHDTALEERARESAAARADFESGRPPAD